MNTNVVKLIIATMLITGTMITLKAESFTLTDNNAAIISVSPDDGYQVLWFRHNAALFTNRDYRIADCPDWLNGKKFLRSSIDTTEFDVIKDGQLLALTPIPISGASSLSKELENEGFDLIESRPFQLFGENKFDKVWVYAKNVKAGESYQFDKWVVVAGFSQAQGALDRSKAAEDKPYEVYPSDIPNTGLLLVDQAKDGRSGHGGITLTECANGDILAFYSLTWAETLRGHGVGGWSQYRRSTDGGRSWGEPVVFEPSKQMWDGREVYSGLVFSVLTAPNGTLVATVIRYDNTWWEKQLAPLYYLSYDNGNTWEEPRTFDDSATVDDISMTLSTHIVNDGKIFIVFRGGTSNMSPGGKHTLWVSEDNGESFQQRSTIPFNDADYYWAISVLDDNSIIVYTYSAHRYNRENNIAEHNIPYVISRDGGYTWSEVETTYFAKGIRNMQMSAKLGDYYFMHGRSGSYQRELTSVDPGPGNFVLYCSKDGINWDEGIVLMSRLQTPGGGDCYSSNEIIGKFDINQPKRLMILSDVSYAGPRTNMHYWWVGTEANALNYVKGENISANISSLSSNAASETTSNDGKELGAVLSGE